MLVAEILKSKGDAVYTLSAAASLKEAAAMLVAKKVGALVVVEGDRVIGILSERDIVRAVAEHGEAALPAPASDYMTRDVIFAQPSETIDALMLRMTDRRVRHLPVMHEQRLSGVVSIGDVVKCKIAEATHEAETLRTYITSG